MPEFGRLYIGGEGQFYFGNLTLYAQGGYQELDFSFPTLPIEGHFLNAQVRYFVTPNWHVTLKGGFDTMDFGGLAVIDTWKAGGGTEYRFDGAPLSLFLDLDFESSTVSASGFPGDLFEIEGTRVLAGLKLNFGSQTLFERDRGGGSLDPMRTNETTSLYGGIFGFACGC